ncbi:hypothetical protein GH714_039262 [Hevea brasiliensis]|uniref:RNase H type-1 domain-containing protein n=1 Tax=Hevea brasiliensis TaxID=3981 RepID=A0A6A6LWX9_HEVBR|nr:hypothetical protein GH714_039262 [Hevea brasiliensis]
MMSFQIIRCYLFLKLLKRFCEEEGWKIYACDLAAIGSEIKPAVMKVYWNMLQEGWHKLNVNGFVKGVNGWVLGGGLIRDIRGNWCSGFALKQGCGSILKAKALALVVGLSLVWNEGHCRILVESDSMELVKMVNDNSLDTYVPLNVKYVLKEIRELLSCSWEIVLIHMLREVELNGDAFFLLLSCVRNG